MSFTPEQIIAFKPLVQLGRAHAHSTCCWCGSHMCAVCDERFWRCPQDACFQRQFDFAVVHDTNILFLPLPIQVELFNAVLSGKYTSILVAGARGTSKSVSLRWLAHWLCLNYPNFRVLLLRRTYPELEESHLMNIDLEADSLLGHYVAKPDYTLTYANGSRLKFGHCAEQSDMKRYLSAAYDLVLLDEETSFEAQQIIDIAACARRSQFTPREWRPCTCGATNPGGISGNYVRSVFIHKLVDVDEHPNYEPADYHCIHSRLEDNAFIDTAEYDRVLRQQGKLKYRQWRYGDWDAFEGQFFDTWRTNDVHDADNPNIVLPAHVVDAANTPNCAIVIDRFCALHWGVKQAGVCYWFVCLPDGTLFVEDEYKFRDDTPERVSRAIATRNRKRGIHVRHIVASDEMWNRKGQTGESLVETFRKAGLVMKVSKHDRVMGWNRVRALLDLNDRGVPYLRVSKDKCPYFCLTFPSLVGNPNAPEDILQAPKQQDAAANAIRYAAMSRPQPTSGTTGVRTRSVRGISVVEYDDIPRELLKGKVGDWRYDETH